MVSPAPRGKPAASAGRPPVQKKKPADNKTLKTVGLGIAAAGAIVFFFMYVFTGKDKKAYLEKRMKEAQERTIAETPPPKPKREEAPVQLDPRPIRLYHEFFPALASKNRTEVMRLSTIELQQIDQLLTDERADLVKSSWPVKRYTVVEEKIEAESARIVVAFMNSRGLEVEALALEMKHTGSGPEDWKISKVSTRWGDGSGKPVEDKFVALGGDRTSAVAPPKKAAGSRTMPEAEPKELDWLKDTPDALKSEIDRLIRDVIDLENPSRLAAAYTRLSQIGKPALPRLLTEMMKLDMRKDEDARKGNAIDRTLTAITDIETGYNPTESGLGAGGVPPAMARVRACRRWFGWWEAHKDLPLNKRRIEEEK